MTVEIVILLARGAFGGAAHVSRFDLARSEQSVAVGALASGGTDVFDRFVSFLSVGGGVDVVIA